MKFLKTLFSLPYSFFCLNLAWFFRLGRNATRGERSWCKSTTASLWPTFGTTSSSMPGFLRHQMRDQLLCIPGSTSRESGRIFKTVSDCKFLITHEIVCSMHLWKWSQNQCFSSVSLPGMPGHNKDSGQKCITLGDTTSENYHHNKRLWDLKLTNCNQRGFYACQHNPGTCLRIFRICFGLFEKKLMADPEKKLEQFLPKNQANMLN